jgi:hypothetical protein
MKKFAAAASWEQKQGQAELEARTRFETVQSKRSERKAAAHSAKHARVEAAGGAAAARVRTADTIAARNAEFWSEAKSFGDTPTPALMTAAHDHALPGEKPWLVVTTTAAGALVAYKDRLMIIKVGLMTSFMTGTLGGGRITTFPFSEITGIEYNGQMMSGVLEILTASYQGTANKDFWRGTASSRNADANDPYTLSNTLPLNRVTYKAALPELNLLRDLIIKSKSHAPHSTPAAVTTPSLGSELEKLAALHSSGHLTDAEFSAAKQAVLLRLG